MYGAPRASLVGDGPSIDAVADALAASDCVIDRVPEAMVASWLSQVRAGRPDAPLPNLIVVGASVAFTDSGASLEALTGRAPWRLLPVVVLADHDDPDALRAAYAAGVASVVVFDHDAPATTAEAFARYWVGTAMLPDADALS